MLIVETFFVKKKMNLLFQRESSLFIRRAHQKKATSISYMDQKQQNQEGNVNDSSLKLPLVLLELPDNGSGSSNEAQKGATVVNGPLLLEDDNRLGLPPGLKMFSSDVEESPHFIQNVTFFWHANVIMKKICLIIFQSCPD